LDIRELNYNCAVKAVKRVRERYGGCIFDCTMRERYPWEACVIHCSDRVCGEGVDVSEEIKVYDRAEALLSATRVIELLSKNGWECLSDSGDTWIRVECGREGRSASIKYKWRRA